MSTKEIIAGLEASKKQAITNYYLSFSIAAISIFTGLFFTIYVDQLILFFSSYLNTLPDYFTGFLLIFFGLLKIIGIVLDQKRIRQISIITLSFIWGSLALATTFYSFGDGFPSLSFILTWKITVDCLVVSTRGLYHK